MVAAVVVVLAACGSRRPTVSEVLDAQLTAHPPAAELLQLDLTAPCALVDSFRIGGVRLPVIGAGTAWYGDPPQGERYQCAFGGDQDGPLEANVRLEVIRLDGATAVAGYLELLDQRHQQTVERSDGADVHVATAEPDAGTVTAGDVYVADIVLPDDRLVVRLLLEVAAPDLIARGDHAEVARLLTDHLPRSVRR